MTPKYSVIIPVYNRPQEVEELLESLVRQTYKNFDVIIIDDGSTETSEKVYEKFSDALTLAYHFKPNSGPGPTRNFGFEKATGDYFVLFDSDCILPPSYFEAVERELAKNAFDAWGGPDRGSEHFTSVQRAMAYTMSSPLTTGGIRGSVSKGFQPRSFNMGIRKEVFQQTGGFHFDRFAEDIEWSLRMKKSGFRTALIPEAYVYHKRRTDFGQFFRQVSNFGKGRVMVGRVHPEAVRLTHWFPAFFLIGIATLPFVMIFAWPLALLLFAAYAVYLLAIAIGAGIKTKSVEVAFLSIPSAVVQLVGYGNGFLKEIVKTPF